MEPEAYQIGWVTFLGVEIHLNSRPLIPRVETEWWTEKLLKCLKGDGAFPSRESRSATAREEAIFQQKNMPLSARESPEPLRFLDLCAGSGAIGCTALKYLPRAEVWFGEIDQAHEATIRKNIEVNGFDSTRAHVAIGDLFAPFGDMRFDVIAANPPYIPAGRELPPEVADYEPALALRSGPDGLDFIRRIAFELPGHLTQCGIAWVECDAPSAEAARGLFEAAGLAAGLMHDQYDRPRVVTVERAV